MTAVEWLIQEHFGGIENCTPDFRNKIDQSKAMEKNQIMDAYISGYSATDNFGDSEKYYNENFKTESINN